MKLGEATTVAPNAKRWRARAAAARDDRSVRYPDAGSDVKRVGASADPPKLCDLNGVAHR